MTFEWTPDLSVGVDLIDREHQELFARANALIMAAATTAAADQSLEALRFLADYVVTHFDAEEQLMAEVSYPDAPAHRAEHDWFRGELARMTRRFSLIGADPVLELMVQREVCEWIYRHVAGTDRRLGQYVTRRA
jgi:hemerythrin